eukprot:366453-Chlamydomonas_euryale.AAC.16
MLRAVLRSQHACCGPAGGRANISGHRVWKGRGANGMAVLRFGGAADCVTKVRGSGPLRADGGQLPADAAAAAKDKRALTASAVRHPRGVPPLSRGAEHPLSPRNTATPAATATAPLRQCPAPSFPHPFFHPADSRAPRPGYSGGMGSPAGFTAACGTTSAALAAAAAAEAAGATATAMASGAPRNHPQLPPTPGRLGSSRVLSCHRNSPTADFGILTDREAAQKVFLSKEHLRVSVLLADRPRNCPECVPF